MSTDFKFVITSCQHPKRKVNQNKLLCLVILNTFKNILHGTDKVIARQNDISLNMATAHLLPFQVLQVTTNSTSLC